MSKLSYYWERFVEFLQVTFAMAGICIAGIIGFCFIILCTPWPWIALIIYLVTR